MIKFLAFADFHYEKMRFSTTVENLTEIIDRANENDVDFVIPGNDDAVRAVKLVVAKMADAVLTGKNGEPMAEVADEDIHSMEELVKVMGEDKIERKQNRQDRRNNRRFEREEKAEVVESNTVAEAKEE